MPKKLTSITHGLDYVSDTSYNASGQVKVISYNNGALYTKHGYYGYQAFGMGDSDDASASWGALHFGRLWRIYSYDSSPLTTLQDLQYGYDPVGNVTRINSVLASSPPQQRADQDNQHGHGQHNRPHGRCPPSRSG